MKKAFTLIEINLAMLIMAGGILSLVGLYSFGFRENAQSVEDVNGAAVADAVISELTKALGATNMEWSTFKNLGTLPARGWRDYLTEQSGGLICNTDPSTKARGVFNGISSPYSPSLPSIPNSMQWALVITHEENSALASIAVRVTSDKRTLMAQPMYFAQVRFQGKQTNASTDNRR